MKMTRKISDSAARKRHCFQELTRLREVLEAENCGDQLPDAVVDFVATMKTQRLLTDERIERISRLNGF